MRVPRWRVNYLLNGTQTYWMIRARSGPEAIEAARLERQAFDEERGTDACANFDYARAMPYTIGDAMDDGTSLVSLALWVGGVAFLVLALLWGAHVTNLATAVAGHLFWLLQVVCVVGLAGYLLYGAAALIYAGITVLRERRQ